MNKTKLEKLCNRVNDQYQNAIKNDLPLVDAFVNATRIWNWIDSQHDADWSILKSICPWAFRDPKHANSIRFFYRDWSLFYRCSKKHIEGGES